MKLRRLELVENTLSIDQKIRHAIARLHIRFVFSVLTQRQVAIRDPNLRNQWKESFSHRVKARHQTGERRKDCGAKKSEQPIRTGNKIEHAIGGIEQSFGVGKSLFVVRVEQLLTCHASDNEREFPGKVVRVLN